MPVAQRITIRWRITITILTIVGVSWGILSVLLYFETLWEAEARLNDEVELELEEAIHLLDVGANTGVIEALLVAEKKIVGEDRYFLQVLDHSGHLIVSCDDLTAVSLDSRDGSGEEESGEFFDVPHPLPGYDGQTVRVLERETEADLDGSGRSQVVRVRVAMSTLAIGEEARQTAGQAAVGLLIVLGTLSLISWFVTGRSLGPVKALTTAVRTISARNMEERLPLTGSGDEIDELADVLNDMLQRLQRAMRQMEDFTSDAAHQLRTPLTRIRGEIDLLLRSSKDDARHQLEAIQEEVGRLGGTCSRLLLLAKLDEQGLQDEFSDQVVALDDLVGELVEQILPLSHDKGVELNFHSRARCRVSGSKHLISEAVLNLIHNAIQYTPAGGSIRVGLDASRGRAWVTVEDSGPGIPLEERERIFQRFHRVLPNGESGTIGAGGLGLGLAIVKGIVEAHGGTVDVECPDQGGSRFRLVFPSTSQH